MNMMVKDGLTMWDVITMMEAEAVQGMGANNNTVPGDLVMGTGGTMPKEVASRRGVRSRRRQTNRSELTDPRSWRTTPTEMTMNLT